VVNDPVQTTVVDMSKMLARTIVNFTQDPDEISELVCGVIYEILALGQDDPELEISPSLLSVVFKKHAKYLVDCYRDDNDWL
jgi:hypothetical protein